MVWNKRGNSKTWAWSLDIGSMISSFGRMFSAFLSRHVYLEWVLLIFESYFSNLDCASIQKYKSTFRAFPINDLNVQLSISNEEYSYSFNIFSYSKLEEDLWRLLWINMAITSSRMSPNGPQQAADPRQASLPKRNWCCPLHSLTCLVFIWQINRWVSFSFF